MDKNKPINEVEDMDAKYYEPATSDEKKFWKLHIVQKFKDVAGNGDDVYSGTIVDANPPHKGRVVPGTEKVFSSIPKKSNEKAINTIKAHVGKFKEHFGEQWKEAMTGALDEDSQAASSDNPSRGGNEVATDVPTQSSNGRGNQDNPTKDLLEELAVQAAKLYDSIEDNAVIDEAAKNLINEAKNALEQAYAAINDRQSDNGAGFTEEVNLEEEDAPAKRGRGRPRKDAAPPEGGEALEHTWTDQMKKAADLNSPGRSKDTHVPVVFDNGDKHKPSKPEALKVLNHLVKIKDIAKRNETRDEMKKSHAHYKYHLGTGPKPPEVKKTTAQHLKDAEKERKTKISVAHAKAPKDDDDEDQDDSSHNYSKKKLNVARSEWKKHKPAIDKSLKSFKAKHKLK